MGNNIHLKRYSVLDELKKALSVEKVKSPGIAILEDGSIYYDKELKRIYPDYKINTGSYDYDEPIPTPEPEIPEPEPEIPTEFSLSSKFNYVSYDGCEFSLTVNSNKKWECEYDSRYISVSQYSSNGNKIINIEVYPSEESRDLHIDFYVEDKKIETFNIYQYDYSEIPFTINVLEDGEIIWKLKNLQEGIYSIPSYWQTYTIYYNINNSDDWLPIESTISGNTIQVKKDDIIRFKGDYNKYCEKNHYDYIFGTFSDSTCSFDISGNICSLINSENFINLILNSYYVFNSFFYNCSKLINTQYLVLPNNVTSKCYSGMFEGCTNLITAPKLPATTLAENCYSAMFSNCTSLITAPELPATTLVNGCYEWMFKNCTSLRTPPQLQAIILAEWCYSEMFYNCTSLTTAPELPATILANYCYRNMFEGCTSLTTAPELPATTLAENCYSAMFSNCTSLITTPELSATTLVSGCYDAMFSGCTSLIEAPELSATTLVNYCYRSMFSDCTKLNYIKCLATDISATNCLTDWVKNVSSSGSFIKNGDIIYTTGSSGIPEGWNVYTSEKEYYTNQPLTFEILSSGYIKLNGYNLTVEYKLNNNNWTTISFPNNINVNKGDIVQFKGDNECYYVYYGDNDQNNKLGTFNGSTVSYNVYGNILSLNNSTNYTDISTLIFKYNNPIKRAFPDLFSNTKIKSAKYLILPNSVNGECYNDMFYNCKSLIIAPELPSTTLAYRCYESMFYGCTSLTMAPVLPATTLANECYKDMFYNCTSLTTAPELPATTLANDCYSAMFRGCTSLTTAPELPTTTLANGCYKYMFYGCTSLRTASQLQAITLAEWCYQYMFYGCTLLTTAPILPATTLVTGCYYRMFYDCKNINYIKCYAIDISAANCLTDWLYNVSYSGNFYKISSVEYSSGVNGIPSRWSKKYLNSFIVNNYNILSMTSSNDIYYIKLEESKNHTITIKNEYPIDWSITSDSGNISFSESSGNEGTFTIDIIGNINEIEYITILGKKLALSYNIDTGKYNEYTFNAKEITNTYSTSNSYKVDNSDLFANIFKNRNNNQITFYINNIKFITNCTYNYVNVIGTMDTRGTWKHLRINNTYPYIYIEVNTYDGSMNSRLESLTINIDKSLNINQGDTFTILMKR